MRPIKPNTRRRPMSQSVLLALLAIVIGGAATVAALAGLRVIDPARLAFWRSNKPKIPLGWVALTKSYRPIPAYTEVTREYLLDPKTGDRVKQWVPPNDVVEGPVKGVIGKGLLKGVVFDPTRIIGRVTAREIPANSVFQESDFLPVGTRPGVVGGTPLGKRAYVFNTSSLDGCVYQVKEGDHVDLLVSVPVDMPGASHSNSGPAGANVIASPDALLRPKRTLEIPLVQDGVVVSPVTARITQITNSSVMNGASTRNVKVEEIVIAVAPAEVAPLDEAKALKYKLTCVARSGRPAPAAVPAVQRPAGGTSQGGMSQVLAALGQALLGKPGTAAPGKALPTSEKAKTVNPTRSETPANDRVALDITPGFNPMADVRMLELMIGTKRQFMVFAGPGNSPVVTGEDDGLAKSAPAATTGAAPPAATEESE